MNKITKLRLKWTAAGMATAIPFMASMFIAWEINSDSTPAGYATRFGVIITGYIIHQILYKMLYRRLWRITINNSKKW